MSDMVKIVCRDGEAVTAPRQLLREASDFIRVVLDSKSSPVLVMSEVTHTDMTQVLDLLQRQQELPPHLLHMTQRYGFKNKSSVYGIRERPTTSEINVAPLPLKKRKRASSPPSPGYSNVQQPSTESQHVSSPPAVAGAGALPLPLLLQRIAMAQIAAAAALQANRHSTMEFSHTNQLNHHRSPHMLFESLSNDGFDQSLQMSSYESSNDGFNQSLPMSSSESMSNDGFNRSQKSNYFENSISPQPVTLTTPDIGTMPSLTPLVNTQTSSTAGSKVSCPVCNKVLQSGSMQNHWRGQHAPLAKPLSCCNQLFSSKWELRCHKQTREHKAQPTMRLHRPWSPANLEL